MVKEILLYTPIYSSAAEAFVNSMEENKGNDVVVRINTDGGDVEDGWSMVAKFAEHKGKKTVKVDGRAHSMGCFFLAYADDAECLDISQFLIHRAAYPQWVEKDAERMTEAMWATLNAVNGHLRAALESKIDVAKFEKLKKVSMDDVFSTSNRLDVFLTAEEAKKIGLVKRIVSITPEKKAELNSLMYKLAAQSNENIIESTEVKQLNTKKMTIEKLKAEHPEIFAQAVAIGVEKEKDRTGAWMAFVGIDAEAVSKGIKEGKEITQTIMAELSLKSFNAQALKNVTADSLKPVVTPEEVNKTEKELAISAFEADVKKGLEKK